MLRSTTRISLAITGALLAVGLLGATVAQSSATGVPIVTTLNQPRGLAPLTGGEVLLSEAGTGRVWRVLPDGTQKAVVAGLPIATSALNGPLQTIGVSASAPDGNGGYRSVVGEANGNGFSGLYSTTGGLTNLIVDLGAYEAQHNTDGLKDAQNNDIVRSNPYDVIVDSIGRVFVTDAGANAVLRHSGGNTSPYFVFPQIANPLFPQNGAVTIEQVPTGITIGPDKALYVATFTAPPYPTGEARVYRLEDKNSDGDALDAGESTVYATGLTAATDLTFDDNGRLYVSEYSTNMLTNQPGRISRIVNGTPTTAVHLLTTPTSLTFTDDGRMIVTEQSIGRVADVSDSPAGGFSSPITVGVTLTSYAGGSVELLSTEASGAGASAVAITKSGGFIVLVPGAPSFVNQAFRNQFPGGVPAGTLLIVVR